MKTKWISAEAEFKALGEALTSEAIHSDARGAHREVPVRISFQRTPVVDGVGSSGGHAGNGLWWSAPKEVFTIGDVKLSAYEATLLARWILSLMESPCDVCQKQDSEAK